MNIALLGYGKMGKMIERLALEAGHHCPLIIDHTNPSSLTKENLKRCDVAIEFSTPETAFHHLHTAIGAGIPVVCGTTGWLERKNEIEAWCKANSGAFLYASNFSLGVNLYNSFVRHIAKKMTQFPEYHISLEESHHTEKKDKPSGTAITIAEILIQETPYQAWQLDDSPPSLGTLSIKSKREKDVVGIHTTHFTSEVDSLSITHDAKSREGFAKGALLAASYIKDKKGIFSMEDVLGI